MRLALIAALAAAALLTGCRLERPDPASQAAAILNKHPSDFPDQLASLDALALREMKFLRSDSAAGKDAAAGVAFPDRSVLAESLYRYSQRLRPALASLTADSSRIALLNAFLFDTLAIVPDTVGDDLAASIPTLILQRRRGACVGLTLMYLALGRSLDLPMVPVFLPGHVFVRYLSPRGSPRNIETLRGGIARSDSFYRETFALRKRPWYSLADARPEQALAALVFNLGNAHRAAGDLAAAKAEFGLAENAVPGFPEALGSLGACLLWEGEKAQAREKFLAALKGDSLSQPALINLAVLGK